MAKESTEEIKYSLFYKVLSYLVIVLMFLIWIVDRALHLLLPHREHPQFTSWAKDGSNVKYAFARLAIFSIPILIFKIIF